MLRIFTWLSLMSLRDLRLRNDCLMYHPKNIKTQVLTGNSMSMVRSTVVLWMAIFLANLLGAHVLLAQEEVEPRDAPDNQVLDDQQWQQLDGSVQRGLKWLATQQKEDGSFDSPDMGQPAVTSFCLMAFLAQGESPANGQYQEQLTIAIDFIVAQQKANGIIATTAPDTVPIPRTGVHKSISVPSVYNHAISGLALAEAYGQCNPDQAERIAPVIEKAIAATLEMQLWGPKLKHNEGGWRYLDSRHTGRLSDLSVSGWHLMFLRSAKNAGFDVPLKNVEAAVGF